MKNILAVENEFQMLLFDLEIVGQLSDGHWENTKPYNHWVNWANAKVIVQPNNVGRNFRAVKDNYGLTSSDLLDVVGDRMIAMCNMQINGYSRETIDNFNDSMNDRIFKDKAESFYIKFDMTDEEIIERVRNNYWYKKYYEMIEIFGSYDNLVKAREGSFDLKRLKKELRGLKNCMQTPNSSL